MRVAVTGGSGRLGRAVLAAGIARGHTLVSIDRVPPPTAAAHPAVEYVAADVTDYGALEQACQGCAALLHLAAIPAPGMRPDAETHQTNVVASYNALQVAATLGITRVCVASSVNAIGHEFSRTPCYDYFPIDEQHPARPEDPYSLSKWLGEQQAAALARRYESLTIASLRFHWIVDDRSRAARMYAAMPSRAARALAGYVRLAAAVEACWLALTADFRGHEVCFIVAPDTAADRPSQQLAAEWHPAVPIRGDLSGQRSFFDSSKAQRLLGWVHDPA